MPVKPVADAVRAGYAAASTDTGHDGGDASFALGHPEKVIDFGYRAVHEMTVKAKAIIAAFYGDAGTQLRDQGKFAEENRKQQEDVDSKKQKLDAAQQKLADLEEQSRKSSDQ